MKEAPIVKKIRDHLKNKYGAECFKHHGGPFSEAGVSDLVCTLPPGRALYIEVKAPGKLSTITPLQRSFQERMARVGAITGVATSVADVDKLLVNCR